MTTRATSWRDPWLLAIALMALVPLLAVWQAPIGEPFADDYDFLHRSLLERGGLLDSGGAVIYWRPLARQAYYALAGPAMLQLPRLLGILHAVLLALAAILIYLAFRPRWGAMRAAAAASFPTLAESARVLILWPAAFQDLGALLFSALAWFAASRRKLALALASLLAALLCKEAALATAILLPWLPSPDLAPGERRRWWLGIGAVVSVWAIAYMVALTTSHVLFQGHLEAARISYPERLLWSLSNALHDAFNAGGFPLGLSIAALLMVVIGAMIPRGDPSETREARRWAIWGALCFVLLSAGLAETYPVWGSFRSILATTSIGLILCAGFTGSRRPWLAALVALRLALFFTNPPAVRAVSYQPPGDGAGFDCATLTRLQLIARGTRQALDAARSPAPPGSAVVWFFRPLMAERAFAHAKSLHVWYRDTTLRWVAWQDFAEGREGEAAAGIEYDPDSARQFVRVAPGAVAELTASVHTLRSSNFPLALGQLVRADSLADPAASAFHGAVAGKRALALLSLDDLTGAKREAERALRLTRVGSDARYSLAVALAAEGRLGSAVAQLDTLLALYPYDRPAKGLRDTLAFMIRQRGGP